VRQVYKSLSFRIVTGDRMEKLQPTFMKLDYIKMFLSAGISVIPLHHRSKVPMLASWEPYKSQLPTNTEYQSWFATDWNNYGVVAGWCNLVIIDFDNIEYFNIWKLHCNSMWVNIADVAFKVRTQRGMHVYVTTETPDCNGKRIAKKGGIDIQAQGKYVVGPGCVHPSGHVYEPIGEMIFPCVESIEMILPLNLFPSVSCDDVEFHGEPVAFAPINTQYDVWDVASGGEMDLISKVKASVRIETLFSGVERSSADGRWLKALCPFHDDAHQSAWIDVRRQIAGCQVCGFKPMDVLNVYARMHNMNESAAVGALAAEVGIWK
jgi:hypothetical protein